MNRKIPLLGLLLLFTAVATPAAAQGVVVENAWARATPGNAPTGAVYFRLANRGTGADRLIAAATPVAQRAELHETTTENGIMRMRPAEPLAIAPGETAELKPGAEHLMLTGLKEPLKAGESFPLTLTFEKAGAITVAVKVMKPGAMGADAMPQGEHGGTMHHP